MASGCSALGFSGLYRALSENLPPLWRRETLNPKPLTLVGAYEGMTGPLSDGLWGVCGWGSGFCVPGNRTDKKKTQIHASPKPEALPKPQKYVK